MLGDCGDTLPEVGDAKTEETSVIEWRGVDVNPSSGSLGSAKGSEAVLMSCLCWRSLYADPLLVKGMPSMEVVSSGLIDPVGHLQIVASFVTFPGSLG